MTDIQEVQLPGVGVRHDFLTKAGTRVGVISHRTGHRELLVYDDRDPDAVSEVLRLEEEDAHALTELLGASHVSETVTNLQSVEGLAIDWLRVDPSSACAGNSIGYENLGGRTGVSIVAVIRKDTTIPSPPADFTLLPGDVAVAVGTAEGLQSAFDILRGQ